VSEEDRIKTKIISFRVSDHEFRVAHEASRKHGFGSVSLFSRAATLKCDPSGPVQSSLDIEINRLFRRIEVLTTILEKLSADAVRLLAPFNKK
jgi:hypothetical protein